MGARHRTKLSSIALDEANEFLPGSSRERNPALSLALAEHEDQTAYEI